MLRCTLASPAQKKLIEGLEGIFLRTITGDVGILSGHMPMVAQLRDGSIARLKLPAAGGELRVRLGAGSFFRFKDDEGIVLTREFTIEAPAAPTA